MFILQFSSVMVCNFTSCLWEKCVGNALYLHSGHLLFNSLLVHMGLIHEAAPLQIESCHKSLFSVAQLVCAFTTWAANFQAKCLS